MGGEGIETKSVLFIVFLVLESFLVLVVIAQEYVCIVHGFNSHHRYIYILYMCTNVCAHIFTLCIYIHLCKMNK